MRVASRFPLRCVPGADQGTAHIVIDDGPDASIDDASRALPPRLHEHWFAHALASDGTLFLRWRDLFEFTVAPAGRVVIGRPLERSTPESFETYLLSQVLSCAFVRQGLEPIHATVVSTDAGAVALLADSGYGKSTLAAHLVQAGWKLVTDDLMIVDAGKDDPVVRVGPSRLKLFPEAAASVGLRGGVQMNDLTPKRIFPIADALMAAAPPILRAMYLLKSPAARSRRKRVTIRPLGARDRFVEFTKGAFNSIEVDRDRLRRQFAHAMWLTDNVRLRTLSFPPGLDRLPDVHTAIANDAFG